MRGLNPVACFLELDIGQDTLTSKSLEWGHFPGPSMSRPRPLSVSFSCLCHDCALIEVSDPAERAGPAEGV